MSTEQILERLMREYGDSVFRMCFLYLKDYHLAEDAMNILMRQSRLSSLD